MPPRETLTPDVSVVIPVKDDAGRLRLCLDALHAQVDAPTFEVVVVDNASSDGSSDAAREHPLGPLVVHEPRSGSYAARNAGVEAASAPLLAFTDADCTPSPTWVVRGVQALGRHAIVGGAVQQRPSARPSVWERYDCAMYLRQQDLVEMQGYGATANLWVRRETFAAVGPFDASLLSSGDLEWGGRARTAGHLTAYAEDVVVSHAARRSAAETWRLHRRLGAGWARVAAQHPEVREALRLPLGLVIDSIAAEGPPLRRRHVAHVHLLAMTARRAGWLAGHRKAGPCGSPG